MTRRRPRLRLRLLLSAGAAILVALAIAWLVMVMLFDRHLERRAHLELTAAATPLLAELEVDAGGGAHIANPPTDPRFELPGSGLYWQISSGEVRLHSRSLWDETLREIGQDGSRGWSHARTGGPFGQRVLQIRRTVTLEGASTPITVDLALDERQLLDARNLFAGEMALFLAILWLALSAAAWLQVSHGLRPLARVREELAHLQQNPQARISDRHPLEIAPLTLAINELAEMRERDLERARRRAADLAHTLKTPLAALRSVSRDTRQAGATPQADALDDLIRETSAAVDAELRRARIGAVKRSQPGHACAVLDIAERVVSVVSRSPAGRQIVFDVHVDAAQTLPLASEDLLEILGALVENAARYARRQVRITAIDAPDGKVLTVEDDGKGLASDAADALTRGARLDQVGDSHHGLGLAIVRELVEATGGKISLNHASLGGLRVALLWRTTA